MILVDLGVQSVSTSSTFFDIWLCALNHNPTIILVQSNEDCSSDRKLGVDAYFLFELEGSRSLTLALTSMLLARVHLVIRNVSL